MAQMKTVSTGYRRIHRNAEIVLRLVAYATASKLWRTSGWAVVWCFAVQLHFHNLRAAISSSIINQFVTELAVSPHARLRTRHLANSESAGTFENFTTCTA